MVSLRGAHINYSPLADENLSNQYRLIFPKVDRFYAVSQAIADEVGKYGVLEQKTDVVHSAINLEYLQLYKKMDWGTHSPFRFISVNSSEFGRMPRVTVIFFSLPFRIMVSLALSFGLPEEYQKEKIEDIEQPIIEEQQIQEQAEEVKQEIDENIPIKDEVSEDNLLYYLLGIGLLTVIILLIIRRSK